tara:strand:+ start:211 stop:402 length:192 start_codon:yes stop_codon:yes gene_type:complete
MAEEKITDNRENIIRIEGELKLLNNKLDNHVSHISSKVDLIFKVLVINVIGIIGWAVKSIIIP